MTAAPALDVAGLVLRYDGRAVVDGASFTAVDGEVLALLGPNGAGKTSTVETCEGYRTPHAGTVTVLGHSPADPAVRPLVGVMPQAGGCYPGLRAAELLGLFASYHRRPHDPGLLLERLGLSGVARTPVRRLSGGQAQRLSLALAVIGRPRLVFLDEPTAGLDPQARHAVHDLVHALRADGVTVVLTTHLMDEAERLADHVVVLDHGRVVADGTVAELVRRGAAGQLRFRAAPGLPLDELLLALPEGCTAHEPQPGRYVVAGADAVVDPRLLAAVTAWCAGRGVLAEDLRVETRSLEDVFLDLTGRELRA